MGVSPAGFPAGAFVWGTIELTAGTEKFPEADPLPVGLSKAFERLRLITCIVRFQQGLFTPNETDKKIR